MSETTVIVGAGPAGVRAAETLVEAGLSPILIDEAARVGGQIYRQPPEGAERPAEKLYGSEAEKARSIHTTIGQIRAVVDYRPNTLVWNCFQGRLNTLSDGKQDSVAFDRLIIATGAFDRIVPFPGWTLPGVFTLGAAQIALKSQGLAIGRRTVLVGAGPLLPLVASQYLEAGAELAAVLDVTPFHTKISALPRMMAMPDMVRRGLSYLRVLRRSGVPMQYGVRSIAAIGDHRVVGFAWEDARGRRHEMACDAVGASFGLKPEMQLADLAGCNFRFDDFTRQWLPVMREGGRGSVPGVYLAGDCSAIGGADVAELTGRRAALAVLEDIGRPAPARQRNIEAELGRHARFRAGIEAAYPFPRHLVADIDDVLMICRCEGVSAGELRANQVKTGAIEMNRLKAFTRVGMGRCQGRVCGAVAAEILAEKTGCSMPDVGRLRGQHPIKPIPLVVGKQG